MHPLTTAMFIVGYALALPIGIRLSELAERGQRAALAGHQFGVVLAGVGWALSGRLVMAVLHLAWAVIAVAWFRVKERAAAGPVRDPRH
ncbi:MAG: hypothetical protein ACK5RL_17975 [Acidimicrobiales bacterium]